MFVFYIFKDALTLYLNIIKPTYDTTNTSELTTKFKITCNCDYNAQYKIDIQQSSYNNIILKFIFFTCYLLLITWHRPDLYTHEPIVIQYSTRSFNYNTSSECDYRYTQSDSTMKHTSSSYTKKHWNLRAVLMPFLCTECDYHDYELKALSLLYNTSTKVLSLPNDVIYALINVISPSIICKCSEYYSQHACRVKTKPCTVLSIFLPMQFMRSKCHPYFYRRRAE